MKKIFLMVVVLCFLSGCVSTAAFKQYEVNKGAQIAEAIEGAQLLLKNWDFCSGMIEEVFSSHRDEMSTEVVEAFEDLNFLSAKYRENGTLSEHEYGRVFGIILRLKTSVVVRLLQQYSPSILQYLSI